MINLSQHGKPIRIGATVIIISALMKILHLPGANLVLILGCSLVVFLQLFHFIRLKEKRLEDALISAVVISFVTYLMMKMLHWPYSIIPFSLGAVSFLLYLIMLMVQSGKAEKTTAKPGPKYTVFIYPIGFMFIIVGSLLKILHWPGAHITLLLGLGLFTVYFFYDLFT